MHPRPFRGNRLGGLLLRAVAASLVVPHLLAGGQPLPPSENAAGTSPVAGVAGRPPLEPSQQSAPGPGAGPASTTNGPAHGWIGDAWIWQAGEKTGFGPDHLQSAAEQDFASLDRWRRLFARAAVAVLACVVVASFAVLFTLARRR